MDVVLAGASGLGGLTVWIGLIVGSLIGLTGMGGGSLLTPALILLLGLDPAVAIGTGLVIATVTKLFGSAAHLRLGNVDGATTRVLLMGSLPGALAGMGLLWAVRYTELFAVSSLIKTAMGATLILAALSIWTRPFWERSGNRAARNPKVVFSASLALAFAVGFMVSLTSVGSGTLIVPFLIFFYRLPSTKVVGTDVLHGLILTAVVASMHGVGGHVDWGTAAAVLAGAVPGVLLGSHMSLLVSRPVMERILGSVLLFSGFKLF